MERSDKLVDPKDSKLNDEDKEAPSADLQENDGIGDQDADLGGKMTFLEHLDELRKRLLHSLIAVSGTFVLAWFFREEVFGFLSVPILNVVPKLVVIRPMEPISIFLKVSFVAAVFVAAPYILFQIWLFIAPGLYRREKKYVLPFLLSSTVLFISGGMVGYYIILPSALSYILLDLGSIFDHMISAADFFNFELMILLGMGCIFQMPVIVGFLSLFGLLTPSFLWKNFRYAFLLIVIVAAIVSPTPDAFSLSLWVAPILLLYLVSIVVSWLFSRSRKKKS